MKQWQEIDGGWTLQRGSKADMVGPPNKLPAKTMAAVFPSIGATSDAIPQVCRWFATLPAQKVGDGISVLVRIGGTNAPAQVWANGQKVGTPLRPWISQVLDLTKFVTSDKPTLIALELEAPHGGLWSAGEGEALRMGPILHEAPRYFVAAGPILEEVHVRADFQTERVRTTLKFLGALDGAKVQLGVKFTAPDGVKGELNREMMLFV